MEKDPAEFAQLLGGTGQCCDETAGTMKINRFLRKLTQSNEAELCAKRDLCEFDSISTLTQASASCCNKSGNGARHIEALFSIMRMLGIRQVRLFNDSFYSL